MTNVHFIAYAWAMAVTATQMRKDLFQTLDKVVQGETVEVLYKGATITVTCQPSGSKLARAVPRPVLLVDPDTIVESDKELLDELEAKWREEAKDL